MKQSQRLRIIVTPVGETGQMTFYTTAKEIPNCSESIRSTFIQLENDIKCSHTTSGVLWRKFGWDVQIDLVK